MTYDEKLDILAEAVENGASREDWEDLVDELELNIHPDTLRKAWSVSPYSGFRVMQHYKEKMASGYCSDEEIKKMEDAKWELQKERYKVQDQRRELMKYAREEARFEHLVEVLKDGIVELEDNSLVRIIKPDIKKTEAALILSDLHINLNVDNVLNFYDISVAKNRMEQLVNKVISKCEIHNVDQLNIELCGDLINGIIQVANKCEQEEDTISSILTASDIISNFIYTIHNQGIEVVVYAVIGNHSRIEKDKKASIVRENFERLIFEYIKLKLPYIKVIQNGYEDFLTYKIKDREIVVTHGDRDTIANAKNHFVNVLNRKIDEIHFGHIHHFNVKEDNGTTIVTNGSLIGVDNYAIGLRCNTKPSQVLRVYSDDICTYNLELD